MKIRWRIVLLAVLVSAGLFGIGTWLHKTVELKIDGENRRVTTWALTVSGLLHSENVALAEADLLSPTGSQWLKEGDVIELQRACQAALLVDGQSYTVLTAARQPAYILGQAGISLSPGDIILADGIPVSPDQTLVKDPVTHRLPALQILRETSYSISEGFQVEYHKASSNTLGEALWQEGIILTTDDSITPALQAPLSEGMKATIQRARTLVISTQDTSYTALTTAVTVGEALSKAGFALQGLDYSLPEEEMPIPEDGHIRVIRVHEESIVEQTPVPFETEYQPAADLEIDQLKVLQAGEYGVAASRIRLRYEDGQEVLRKAEEEWIARPPQNLIIAYGTNPVTHSTDTPDGTITYWRVLRMYATSYSPSSAGGNITASGQVLRKGLVAVNPSYIPYGTRLYIPGYGEAVASDTGRLGSRSIDLGYSDEDYVAWHQYVDVYFLWPPPANITWMIP
jgi:resuscitation-promoting factor RpfB